VDQAVEELRAQRGQQFDPAVIDAFGQLIPADLVEPAEPVDGADGWGDRHAAAAHGAPDDPAGRGPQARASGVPVLDVKRAER
jgi:hypothetical protein